MSVKFAYRSGPTWAEPWDDYRALRDEDPVHEVGDGEFWVLSRFDDVFAAARDTATYSSANGLTTAPDDMASFDEKARPIVMMDPPEHTAMRRLVSRPMTPRQVAPVEDLVRAFINDKLDAVADAGDVDIIQALFKPLPSYLVAHYLGVPPEDRVLFDRWTERIVQATAESTAAYGQDQSAFLELFEYATGLIERRKTDPGDDLVTGLVEQGEDVASAMWIVGFIFTMITGGNDTVTGMLGSSTVLLDRQRDQRQMLIDDASMIPNAVEELLRLTSPVQNLARTLTRDVTLHGVTIPDGKKALLLFASANRDEREFGPTAGELDVKRKIDKIVSLGYGAHHCLGASVARLQCRVALEEILRRFPGYSVDEDTARFAGGWSTRRYEYLPFTTN